MNPKFSVEPPRSTEEDDALGRSVKRFKEGTGFRQSFQPRTPVSYKDTLLGDIPGVYEQAFKFDLVRDDDVESESELEPLTEGMADVKLSKETLMRIREPWSKALIVKVFGRTVGYNYLTFKINALWQPAAKLDCVHLGRDFYLIRFPCVDDYDKVLKGGPWFVASEAKLSSVAVWVRFPELPIEFYDRSVLKEIGSVIGPVLRIDSYTASGTRGSYARLCVQVDLEKPLITVVRIGKCKQAVMYEGISSLCFSCGCLGHTQGNCCYSIKPCEDGGQLGEASNQIPIMGLGCWLLGNETTLPDLAREDVMQQEHDESMDTVEVDLLVNKTSREDSRIDPQESFEEGSSKKHTQSSKFRSAKSLGIKSSKTLKRQAASFGSKVLNNPTTPLADKSLSAPNGAKLPRIDASPSVRMGDLLQKQGNDNFRRDDSPDKGSANGLSGLVRIGLQQRLEESVPYHSYQHQDRESCPGQSGLVSNTQSLVETPPAILGGIREFEQAKEAVSHASLRRIKVDCTREEDCGFQRVGFSTYGESSYVEADSNYGSDQEMRSATLLQRGYIRDSQVPDGMETGLDNVQGPSEEARMEHGRCSVDES
ncbi:hypothetical protein CFP56_009989 [Quercus suber]|uniref:DUF4283 domain-containing protein n=1 Tax=Quercus suber TaxID=58331 RepID=A0AAW0L4A4_QUESU